MKNYCTNANEEAFFIKKYKIINKDNKKFIKLYLASGHKLEFEYSSDIEKEILDTMENQVRLSNNSKDKLLYKKMMSKILSFTLYFLMVSFAIIGSFYVSPLFLSLCATCGIASIHSRFKSLGYDKKYKDLEKNITYLENKQEIEDAIGDTEVIRLLDDSTIKDLYKVNNEEVLDLNINKIDSISNESIESLIYTKELVDNKRGKVKVRKIK